MNGDLKVTIKIGRILSFASASGGHTEAIVVAVVIHAEANVSTINLAADLVRKASDEVLAQVPDTRLFGEARLRAGWSPAIIQEIIAPIGEGAKHGYPYQRGK